MSHRTLVAAASLLAFIPIASVSAQTFAYPNFTGVLPLTVLGSAAQSGPVLQLTTANPQRTGWAWHQVPMPVVQGFDTSITFRITPPTTGVKGEGFAFVLHNDPNGVAATGGQGWGMGYGFGTDLSAGIRNSIAFEVDTLAEAFNGDTGANEISIHTRGSAGNQESEQYSIGSVNPATSLSDGGLHTLRIRYRAGQFEIYLDGSRTPTLVAPYDFGTGGTYLNNRPAPAVALNNGSAYVGFCASTGPTNQSEQLDIISWTWSSLPTLDLCYEGSNGADVLRVNGSDGGPLRTVVAETFQPVAIDMLSPPGFGTGAPWALAMSVNPVAGGSPGTVLPFGSMCMQVSPLGAGEIVLATSVGTGALMPGGPTPFTLTVPATAASVATRVLLQGIVAVDSSNVGVTNAVTVDFRKPPAPRFTSMQPLSAAAGQPITITGAEFRPGVRVLVSGAPVVVNSSSATQVTIAYPAGAVCDAPLLVANPDGQTASAVLNPTPVVTSTSLSSGTSAGGQLFVVQGTGFAPGTTVTIGGAAATVQSAAPTAVVIRTPPGTVGQAVVVLTTPGGCSVNTTYTYL